MFEAFFQQKSEDANWFGLGRRISELDLLEENWIDSFWVSFPLISRVRGGCERRERGHPGRVDNSFDSTTASAHFKIKKQQAAILFKLWNIMYPKKYQPDYSVQQPATSSNRKLVSFSGIFSNLHFTKDISPARAHPASKSPWEGISLSSSYNIQH